MQWRRIRLINASQYSITRWDDRNRGNQRNNGNTEPLVEVFLLFPLFPLFLISVLKGLREMAA